MELIKKNPKQFVMNFITDIEDLVGQKLNVIKNSIISCTIQSNNLIILFKLDQLKKKFTNLQDYDYCRYIINYDLSGDCELIKNSSIPQIALKKFLPNSIIKLITEYTFIIDSVKKKYNINDNDLYVEKMNELLTESKSRI
jgi:hypothetical protein